MFKVDNMKGVKGVGDKRDSIGKEQSGTANVMVTRDSNAILGDKPLFASVLHEESSKNKVNFCTLVTDDTNSANVLIRMSSVLEVYASLEGVLEHGPWLIRNVLFILRKWTPNSMLTKEELTSVPVWIKFHGVPVSAFTTDGLSVIATRLGTPIMVGRALKDTMIISVPNLIGNGVTMHTIKGETSNDGFQTIQRKDSRGPLGSKQGTIGNHSLSKQQMPKSAYQKKMTSTLVSNAFSALEEDNEKPMDDLVDDTLKKVEAPPKKTPRKIGIWSGRKANSPKRNIVFSPETKIHYFNRDDMEFDDMGQVVVEEENENTYSENG
ncbi:reverse transcriptase domain-containing protein [Tanacetum coccineum]